MEMFELFGVTGIAIIAVICFLIGEAVKALGLDHKWVPIICGVCGGILGCIAMNTVPDFPGHDILTSIAIGIVSGWGAVGAHQTYKQLTDTDKRN